jgi:hypothetical protein
MRSGVRLLAIGLILACLLAALVAALAGAQPGRSAGRGVVPASGLLVADLSGRVFEMSRTGRVGWRVPGSLRGTVQALAIAPDRRHAYVALYTWGGGVRLSTLDLATGRLRVIGPAFSPALNPARTRLAYVRLVWSAGLPFVRALVVVDLRTRRARTIAFPPEVVVGTPPELVINWSPDGTRIAVFDGHRIRLVDPATAGSVESQPSLPASARPSGLTPWFAPVYLNSHELVVDANCCQRRQHLAAVDLRTGTQSRFATLSSPPQNIWRLGAGTLMAEDALSELVLVSRHHVRVIASGIAAAAG